MGRNSTPSKENSPAIKRTRRKILDEDTNSDEENINKTPSKKSKVKNPGTPIPKLKLKKVQILHCDDDDVYFVKDISNEQVSKRRKASAKPNLDDVTEGSTEDDEDEDVKETIAMYGKYGKVMSSRHKPGRRDQDSEAGPTFGFATPKKNNMIERTNSILSATKKTPITKALDRLTPSKTGRRSVSAPTTPTSSPKGTPLRGLKLSCDGASTPKTVRKRISREIEKKVESDDDEEDEEESEESNDEDDSSDDEGVKPLESGVQKKKISTRIGTSALDTDDYFERQATTQIVTSDKTLSQLKTPRLSPEVLKNVLDGEPLKYEKQIKRLCKEQRSQFSKWIHLLNEDFNVILYGLGSKRDLLSDFQSQMLKDKDCVVINGFFPSLTMKNILTSVLFDILDYKGTVGTSLTEQADCILKAYNAVDGDVVQDDLYLLIHNIDGPMLRNDVAQTVLSSLAAHSRIHLICSVDHINAPLLWDQNKLAKFNFIWHDATTFLPYTEETLNENSLMVRSTGSGLQLNSLLRVFESLTPNAKEIYLLIIRHQMKAVEEVGFTFYQGISFKDLYRQCRPAFLVNSDLTLRAQLTEYLDHKLIYSKKGADGMDYLIIPLENVTLEEFMDKN